MPMIPPGFAANLTGEFGAIDKVVDRLGKLGDDRLLAQLSGALGREAVVQVRDGFREERDPYGNKWDRKVFDDGNKILRKSGKLYDSWYVSQADSTGWRIASSSPYAKYQTGTGLYGPRGLPIVPKRARALRIPGAVGRTGGGQFRSGAMFLRSVRGAKARLMVPEGRIPPIWQRAFAKCARDFLAKKLEKLGR